MKVLIIGSGTIKKTKIIKTYSTFSDYIICADGGASYALRENIKPNLILGDLDSIDNDDLDVIRKENINIKKYPTNKDKTDMELAIEEALKAGAKEITMMGAIGTRLDHTMCNIMLLYPLLKRNIKAKIVDENNVIYMINKRIKINKNKKKYISIIPLFSNIYGVSTKGFKYEVKNQEFKLFSTLGISNELLEDEGEINIDKGICLVINSKD